jgi:hypothetical protein
LAKVNRGYSNVLYQVLTVDPEISRTEAYYKITEEFNHYKTRLEQKYGKIYHIISVEATLNAYPHLNVILLFENYRFRIKKHISKKNGRITYRLANYKLKEEIANLWHRIKNKEIEQIGTVDIQAPKGLSDLADYVMKYCLKDLEHIQEIPKEELNYYTLKRKALISFYIRSIRELNKERQKVKDKKKIEEIDNQIEQYFKALKEIAGDNYQSEYNPKYEALFKALVNIAILWLYEKRNYSYSIDLIKKYGNKLLQNYKNNLHNLKWDLLGIYSLNQINEFLIWFDKIKKYANIILIDNLLIDYLVFKKIQNKKLQIAIVEKAKQKIKLISSQHKPISLFEGEYEREISIFDCRKDNSPSHYSVKGI